MEKCDFSISLNLLRGKLLHLSETWGIAGMCLFLELCKLPDAMTQFNSVQALAEESHRFLPYEQIQFSMAAQV